MIQSDNDTIINVLKPNDLKGSPIVAGPNSPTQALKVISATKLFFCYKVAFDV